MHMVTDVHATCRIIASSGAILVNKHIMVDLNFPYPGTVGAIGMVGTSIITFVAVRVLQLVPMTQKVSLKFFTTQVMPTGLFLALSMQLGNTAYLHLSGESRLLVSCSEWQCMQPCNS